jgi:hypothetical protein
MNRIIRIMILFLITGFGKTTAQEVKKWTLQDCINYAVENNIGLQRQMLQTIPEFRFRCTSRIWKIN